MSVLCNYFFNSHSKSWLVMGPALQGFSAGESRAGEAGKPGSRETKEEKCAMFRGKHRWQQL